MFGYDNSAQFIQIKQLQILCVIFVSYNLLIRQVNWTVFLLFFILVSCIITVSLC